MAKWRSRSLPESAGQQAILARTKQRGIGQTSESIKHFGVSLYFTFGTVIILDAEFLLSLANKWIQLFHVGPLEAIPTSHKDKDPAQRHR